MATRPSCLRFLRAPADHPMAQTRRFSPGQYSCNPYGVEHTDPLEVHTYVTGANAERTCQ